MNSRKPEIERSLQKNPQSILTLGALHALREIVLDIQLLKCSRCYQL